MARSLCRLTPPVVASDDGGVASGIPTGDIPAGIDIKLAIATQGKRVNLPGGLPIIVDGHVVGGIGVGSGTGEEDRQVANAALGAFAGAKTF